MFFNLSMLLLVRLLRPSETRMADDKSNGSDDETEETERPSKKVRSPFTGCCAFLTMPSAKNWSRSCLFSVCRGYNRGHLVS